MAATLERGRIIRIPVGERVPQDEASLSPDRAEMRAGRVEALIG